MLKIKISGPRKAAWALIEIPIPNAINAGLILSVSKKYTQISKKHV